MKLHTVLLTFVVTLAPIAISMGHELITIGTLPKLSADWEILVDEQPAKIAANPPFHWVAFRNKTSGDFLSFATRPPEIGKKRGLEYLSDTALEIFPDGRPVWTHRSNDATMTVLNIRAVVDKPLKGEEVLEYCYVSESSARDNLMAHGRAWVCTKGIVFVQHTSAKPITADLVQETMCALVRGQRENKVP